MNLHVKGITLGTNGNKKFTSRKTAPLMRGPFSWDTTQILQHYNFYFTVTTERPSSSGA